MEDRPGGTAKGGSREAEAGFGPCLVAWFDVCVWGAQGPGLLCHSALIIRSKSDDRVHVMRRAGGAAADSAWM